MGLQERARLDGRVAKWCTIQLLDAASRSAARAASADRIAAAWLRRRAIAAADCGAHDTNAMYHIDDTRKNISVSGLRRPSRQSWNCSWKNQKTLRTAAAAPRWIGSGARSSLTLTGVGGDGVGGDGDGGVFGGGGGGAGVGIAAPARSYVDGLLWLLPWLP